MDRPFCPPPAPALQGALHPSRAAAPHPPPPQDPSSAQPIPAAAASTAPDAAQAQTRLRDWLVRHLDAADLAIIPADDPLRAWWQPAPGAPDAATLFDLLDGSRDALTLVALVQAVRVRLLAAPQPQALPAALEQALAGYLAELSQRRRAEALPAGSRRHAVFVSYSHRDLHRVNPLLDHLRAAGVSLFQDVHEIGPGDRITVRLTAAIHAARLALVIVSADYLTARWTRHELQVLHHRERAGLLQLLPVLMDPVDLPEDLRAHFTIDLRGLRGAEDLAWAAPRLDRLLPVLGAAAPNAPPEEPLR